MGFAIPINDVKNYVTYLEKGKEIQRPSIGISVIDVNDRYSLYRNGITISSDVKQGVVISDVETNKSAYQAGLKKGDIITKFDNNKITSISSLRYYLYQYKTGDIVKVTYIREGKEETLDMKLIEND